MNVKKAFLWFYMLSKRLILRWSFAFLLVSIPLLIIVVNTAVKQESGILTIHLCADKNNAGANEVIENILICKTTILFKKSCNLDSSLKALENQKADAVWYFKDELNKKTDDYVKGKTKKPFVQIFEREDTLPLKLSREKLFGGVFSKLSYSLYKDFVYSEFVTPDVANEDVIKSYIGKRGEANNVVIMETLGGKLIDAGDSYLIAPMRGLLALLIMLCGFASALVFIDDRNKGRFDWITAKTQIIPAFAQCFSGVIMASAVVLISLFCTDIFTGILNEAVSLLLFSVASALFCLNLCMLFKSAVKFAAAIPAFVILMLTLSPVFFNINVLNAVKLFLPTHYYLHMIYDTSYTVKIIAYILLASLTAFLFSNLRSVRK